MNKQIILTQLSSFGLDDIEAKIYLHLLEKGPRKPLELSRDTDINRSRIYRYIDKLIAKKLIEVSDVGRGKKLQASNPQNLELLIYEKEQEAKAQKENFPDLLKELTSFTSNLSSGFDIKHYHGADGMKQMLWNHLSADKELLFFSYETRNEVVGKTFAETVRAEQVRRKITQYEIENATDQGDYWYTDVPEWGKYYKSRYIPPKILDIKQYQTIYNNTVSIMRWAGEDKIGIEINNALFVRMYRQIFWKFWDIAGEYIEEGKKLEQAKKLKLKNKK
jgi:sugar-specific transcriptional regulator TrmB